MQKIPIKLEPTPIVSAVVEIKFISSVPGEAVFGIIYPLLSKEYKKFKKLPVLQIPNDIRDRDPSLIFAPHYEFYDESKSLKILVGPKVIAIAFHKTEHNEYPGWTEYIEEEILGIYSKIFESALIDRVTRFAIRYTDFFGSNIFENTEYKVSSKEEENLGLNEKIQFSRNFQESGFYHNIVISNNSAFKVNNKQLKGSIVDIDTYMESVENFEDDYKKILNECHLLNKNKFFNILKEEYVNKEFNAKYQDT
ncbi:MAG: TIGR04255 family protein [Helicobacteraceae bacterium]|nr:TIGR04255 family protein [Helicobacteraceae bacterium]